MYTSVVFLCFSHRRPFLSLEPCGTVLKQGATSSASMNDWFLQELTGRQTEEAESNSCRTVWDSTRMFLVSNRNQQSHSHNALRGLPIGVLMLRKNGYIPHSQCGDSRQSLCHWSAEGGGCAERERKHGERGGTTRKEVENRQNSLKKRGSCLHQHH